MKKLALIITVFLACCLLIGCDSGSDELTDQNGNKISKQDVDIDFTVADDPYNTILNFMNNPSDFQGKKIAIEAQSSVVYNFAQNKVTKHIMLGLDPTGCCNSFYEIRTADGSYPKNGVKTLFVGDFTSDGYISVSEYSGSSSTAKYDIDTLNMSASELESFIFDYTQNYSSSPNATKTIRIFGHHQIYNGYKFLMGLTGEGAQRWIIELYDPTGSLSFPVTSGNLVNPVEIIGTLSFYVEGENTYACITVKEVNKVECVFK